MLERIHIQNYKCLKDTEVTLGAFNVLIGPNDSGKTSFLEAVQLLGSDPPGELNSRVWQKAGNSLIRLAASGRAQADYEYTILFTTDNGWIADELFLSGGEVFSRQDVPPSRIRYTPNNHSIEWHPAKRAFPEMVARYPQNHAMAEVLKEFQSSRLFSLNPPAMRQAVRAAQSPMLSSSGDNLAAVLQTMLSGPDRQSVNDLETKLREAISSLKGVSTRVVDQDGRQQVEFTLNVDTRPPVTIPCTQASDGAMLLIAFLVLAYGNTPRRLLIEEPENGLHPSRLEMVVDILRKISTGEIGNQPRQVILTTHSPLLLNYVQPEEIRIFRRDPEEGTKVTPMDQLPNVERLRREFAPGELWYLFGEEDLVKGQAQ